jgi:hypothetical protein
MRQIQILRLAALLATAALSNPVYAQTDFGVRTVGATAFVRDGAPRTSSAPQALRTTNRIDLTMVARLGSQFGRVTSLRRTVEHNRRVGGVANSYHLSGQAVDIARAPGIRHSSIDHAFRAAGYTIIESLDEGDHTHLAFRSTPVRSTSPASASTTWRIVSAP